MLSAAKIPCPGQKDRDRDKDGDREGEGETDKELNESRNNVAWDRPKRVLKGVSEEGGGENVCRRRRGERTYVAEGEGREVKKEKIHKQPKKATGEPGCALRVIHPTAPHSAAPRHNAPTPPYTHIHTEESDGEACHLGVAHH